MHSQKSTRLSKRAYKKWAERSRMSFHTGVGIVCVLLYLLLANIKTPIPPSAALWIFGINFLVGLVQWNQHRLYRFANSSRYMKGIPEEKLQVINGMYLILFLLVTAGLVFLLMQLPLVEIGTTIMLGIRDALRFALSGFARTALDETMADTGSDSGMFDYFAELRENAPETGVLGELFEKFIILLGIVLTCLLVVYTLVKIYRAVWERVRFQFDDEVMMIAKEDKEERVMKKPSFFGKELHRDGSAQFRRAYRKMIRRRIKKSSEIKSAWTPEEIEMFAGLKYDEGQNQKIHEMYEVIRYGKKEDADFEAAEELQRAMKQQ